MISYKFFLALGIMVMFFLLVELVKMTPLANKLFIKRKKQHPEQGSDEVFIVNADDKGFSRIGWKTKRKGIIAYNFLGIKINGVFPVFAKKHELKAKAPKILKRLEA